MRRLLSALSLLGLTVTACSPSEPTLPTSTQPSDVREFVIGPDGPSRLESISTYEWPDGGAKPASYFEWIGVDATASDPAVATRAGETAHVLASFLGENQSELDSIAPRLVAVYGQALTPFQAAMVGESTGVEGFGRLGSPGDFTVARGVFAVIATEADAGTAFVESAYDRSRTIAADAAEAGCVDKTLVGGTVPAAVREAAELSALAASADPKRNERRQSIDEITHAMAAACVAASTLPPEGRITQFVQNGVLMSPDAARQLDPGLEDYFQSQRDYLAVQGISLNEFSDAYDQARG